MTIAPLGTSKGKINNKNKSTTTAQKADTTAFDTDFLFSVCGVDSPVLCGESMLSKVTTLFGASSAATDDETPPVEEANSKEVVARADADDAEPKKPKKKKKQGGESADDNGDATGSKVPKKKKSIKKKSTIGSDEDGEKSPKPKVTKKKSTIESEGDGEKSPKPKAKKKKSTIESEGDGEKSPKPKATKKKSKIESEEDGEKSPKQTTAKGKKKKAKEEPVASPTASSLKSTSAYDDGSDDDNLMEEDLDQMLENLEIPDFQLSMAEIPEDQFEETDNSVIKKPWETVNWKERMSREEVYSKRYRPKRTEARELQSMADVMGLSKSSDLLSLGKRMSMSIGMGSRVTEDVHKLFFGEHSILLSILPVQFNGTNCDILLLTDGFVLKYQTFNAYNPLEKRYETCQFWDSVEFCERSGPFSVTIQIDSSSRYELEAVQDGENLDTIFKHLERVITQHDMHASNDPDRTDALGWQYLRIRKPVFTAAVSNDEKLLSGKHTSRGINEVDVYNHYAPLHYAVLQDEPNPNVIKALLKAGADPNLFDGDERSAMYYGRYFEERGRNICPFLC
jgi:hypothetical protein